MITIQPKHIHYLSCPDCRAPFHQFGFETCHSDGSIHRHVNGTVWEYIVFTCGRKDMFVPNFSAVQTERPCANTPAERAKVEKRKAALEIINKAIQGLDVDDEARQRLTRDYRFILT